MINEPATHEEDTRPFPKGETHTFRINVLLKMTFLQRLLILFGQSVFCIIEGETTLDHGQMTATAETFVEDPTWLWQKAKKE